jgi:hypothetical protein
VQAERQESANKRKKIDLAYTNDNAKIRKFYDDVNKKVRHCLDSVEETEDKGRGTILISSVCT